jgi:hypothetical protein
MNINDIIQAYCNREDKPRVIGRYNSSELYSIIKGYTTPKTFFKPRKIDERGSKYISEGVAIEDYIAKVFETMKVDAETQVKKEVKMTDEITLVAKTDFHFKEFIVELKRPKEVSPAIPEKWAYQLESYHRAFNLPVYLWQVSYPCSIKQLFYTPSEERWQKIKKALIDFHEKVKKN